MKEIGESFAAYLASGALSTCLCWKLQRTDGFELGVTDHDGPVVFGGLTYQPGAALQAGRFETAGGLRPGRAAAAGALSSSAISEENLAAGLWNEAQVSVYRVDWSVPDNSILVWTGYLTELTQTGAGFEAGLISLKADLERPLGRTYSRRCDARLGDGRCGLADVAGQSCDKRFSTCRDVFSNSANFRGFPAMPGQDFVLAGPSASGNDGGKR